MNKLKAHLLYILNSFVDGRDISEYSLSSIEDISNLWNKALLFRRLGRIDTALNLIRKSSIDNTIFKALYGEMLLLSSGYEDGIDILSKIEDLTQLPLSLKLSVALAHLGEIKGIQDEDSLKLMKRNFIEKEGIKLNILFYALHNKLAGGAKIFFEYANRLSKLGHNVCIASRVQPPDWFNLEVPWIEFSEEHLRFSIISPDVVFSMFWTLVPNTLTLDIPIKILLEQGDPTLYEPESFPKDVIQTMDNCYISPIRIFTVSKNLKGLLKERYGRDSFYVPNGIDTDLFKPIDNDNTEPIIMLVGADELYFKGIKEIFESLSILRERGYNFKVRQVTPTGKVIYNFEREVITRPPQEELARLYATSDIFVTGSYFETFHLPPLEAMACGAAVVTTDNKGVEYCKDAVNSLIVPVKDPLAMASAIEKLLLDESLRKRLVLEGIKTAREYSWDKIIDAVENELYNTVISPNIITNSSMGPKGILELKDRNYLFTNINYRLLREIITRYIDKHFNNDSSNLIIANSPEIKEEDLLKVIEDLNRSPEDVPNIILIEEPISKLDIWSISQYLDDL